jgi:hypothetical protein
MNFRIAFALALTGVLLVPSAVTLACCPAGPRGKPVVNADQSVIIIWDKENQTQHFIRKASFKSGADDFGFLVPTPGRPELDESGNEAFDLFAKITAPAVIVKEIERGAGATKAEAPAGARIEVLERKEVAGFDAAVLKAASETDLNDWLKQNGYESSPQVQAWAKPYVEQGWMITALKVAKPKDGKPDPIVNAAALRISFKTDRPLFPYREPDYGQTAEALGARQRLLRIFFVADARYQGELTKDQPWTGRVAWSGKVKAHDRAKALELLKLPAKAGPAEWWLTEFEDPWPYKIAPADVYFARSENQESVRREPIVRYVSVEESGGLVAPILAAAVMGLCLVRGTRG